MTEAPAADPTIDRRAGTSILTRKGELCMEEMLIEQDDLPNQTHRSILYL